MRSCIFFVVTMRNYVFSIVITRKFVAFFRNYRSHCDRSYGVTVSQIHRSATHGSSPVRSGLTHSDRYRHRCQEVVIKVEMMDAIQSTDLGQTVVGCIELVQVGRIVEIWKLGKRAVFQFHATKMNERCQPIGHVIDGCVLNDTDKKLLKISQSIWNNT